jgi:Arc/MetJ-type ribon-helix-helix transcriptional regulator
MKVSVSLPDDDVDFIDRYATERGASSRSSVVRHAIALLRAAELSEAYEAAWREWDSEADAELWNGTAADGIAGAPR